MEIGRIRWRCRCFNFRFNIGGLVYVCNRVVLVCWVLIILIFDEVKDKDGMLDEKCLIIVIYV